MLKVTNINLLQTIQSHHPWIPNYLTAIQFSTSFLCTHCTKPDKGNHPQSQSVILFTRSDNHSDHCYGYQDLVTQKQSDKIIVSMSQGFIIHFGTKVLS